MQPDMFQKQLDESLCRGVDSERIKNPTHSLEKIFSDAWVLENSGYKHSSKGLLNILYLTHTREDLEKRFATLEEQIAAATAIQWLGTNIGFAFLCNCLKKENLMIDNIPVRVDIPVKKRIYIDSVADLLEII